MDDDLEALVRNALGQAFGANGDMLTHWVLLDEIIDEDGERAVWNVASEDARAWDTLGLLTYAVQIEQAGIVGDRLADDD